MKINKYYSYNRGILPKGCQLCVQGRKLVLFITGICPRNCWYCTLSEQKYQKDIIYANERPINNDVEIIEEARESVAQGAGITGGDPLTKLDRTVRIITLLKMEFGKKFHIHLYTTLELITKENLNALYQAGLDEIRFHPDIKDSKNWKRLVLAKEFDWSVGVEIPLIPDFKEDTLKLIDYIKDKVDFINLNELESADTDNNKVTEKGYNSKDETSYAIEGSEELAREIFDDIPLENVHFCTAKLKDRIQLGQRLIVRAKNTAKKYDLVTPEGSLIRGAIYFEKPSFNYIESLKKKNKEEELKKLKQLKTKICTSLKITRDKVGIDDKKYRLLTSRRIIVRNQDKIKSLGLIPAIVEEYPTYDLFEIEIEFL